MATSHQTAGSETLPSHVTGFHGVRYLVKDVERAVTFYHDQLGFAVEHQQVPAFATVALDSLKIHLSGPGASGSRPLPHGGEQAPGGSNRVILRVRDLPTVVERLRAEGVPFRNEIETGPAGKQVQILDPDDNPIELFESSR